jgi:hypothetical protein
MEGGRMNMIECTTRLMLVGILAISAGVSVRTRDARDAHDEHGIVQADRVLIGAEYIPRRTDLPRTLIVPAGKTVELPEQATYDYIEVAGTLRVSRTHDTQLRFTHLINLPGGTIDVGTQADPIPCDRRVELVIRDVPIDTTKDPFQWGNGFVNFGHQSRVGCRKTAFIEATDSVAVGATEITLASPPVNWQVGDELLIPDTAPPAAGPRREAPVKIGAIRGAVLTISKALDFGHPTITDPNGVVVLRPRVVNLTRNIMIGSEHELGSGVTRGHTVDVGTEAKWDVRYNQFIALGRTLDVRLDDTVPGTHIGTNERGKYVEHHHHAGSSVGSADVGNVYLGNRSTTKWALVVHGTSDTLVEENVAVDFPGAGFVTEDGYEVRNVFRRNFAAYIQGDPIHTLGFPGQDNVNKNCPGCEGSGFWFRGVMNTFDGNEAWNNFRGINLFNQQHLDGQYPSRPGAMPDTKNTNHQMRPILMTGNIVAANVQVGLEFWAVTRFPNVNLTAAYNGAVQVQGVQSDGIDHWYRNPRVICRTGSAGTVGMHSSRAYTASFQISDGGEIAGCAVGIGGGGGVNGLNLSGVVLQNVINIDSLPQTALFENVRHVPLGSNPHQYILFNNDGSGGSHVWNGEDPLPRVGISTWVPQRGSRLVVKNWQGTGQDYLLFYRQQLGNNPAWYSGPHQHVFNTPVKGLTMLQSWEQFGLSYGGDVLKESEAVQLDGLVEGYARAGLGVAFGPPRAIVTFPTLREPALGPDGRHPSVSGYVTIYAIVTGDPNAASGVMMMSIDGEPPHDVNGDGASHSDDRVINTTHIAPGVHTVKVWRTKKDGKTMVPGSEFTAQYIVAPVDPSTKSAK